MTKATLTQEDISLGLAYRFRGLVLYHQVRKHGGVQAAMVQEKELRGLHPGPQAAEGDWISHCMELEHKRPQILPFQRHSPANKATPTPTRPHLLIVPLPTEGAFT